MKWKIVLLLCGISLIIGYFLGVFLPLGLGPCEMTNTPISKKVTIMVMSLMGSLPSERVRR